MLKFVILALALLSMAMVTNGQRPKTRSQLTTATPTLNNYNLTFIVSARDLPAKTKTTKLNPYIKITYRNGSTPNGTWTDLGKTDQLKDTNTNVDWDHVFWFVWTRGTGQIWHFEVKDHHSLSRDSSLGTVDVDVDDYVLKKNQDLTIKLSNGGQLVLKKTVPVKFRLYARNLPKMDSLGGLSDPFVECYWRIGKNGSTGPSTLFYKTKVIDNVENPDWDETIEFSNYQKGTDQWWNFKVWDLDPATSNDFLGEVFVEVDPFVEKRATKNNKLITGVTKTDSGSKAQLTLTPAA